MFAVVAVAVVSRVGVGSVATSLLYVEVGFVDGIGFGSGAVF